MISLRGFLLICMMCSGSLAFAQTAKMEGVVRDADSKVQLESATVVILSEDSSIIAYQLTDRNGIFRFDDLPLSQKIVMGVSHSGYLNFYRSFSLLPEGTDSIDVFLSLDRSNTLDEVILTSIMPIRMNGDTLEINPAAFKMREDAVVEELLAKVNGMVIWSDGTISLNGRPVNNVFVDGKLFMGSTDVRTATQNLPKTAIEKIQVYQEYDRSKIGKIPEPQDSLLTMNIKLKEDSKQGYFGKASAGYGTRDRFETDLTFQVYNKVNSFGIGGGFNNTNKNFGDLQELFTNSTYRSYNPYLFNTGRGERDGVHKNRSIGALFSHDFNKAISNIKQNLATVRYTHAGVNTFLTSLQLRSEASIATPLLYRAESSGNNNSNSNNIAVDYVKSNNYHENLSMNGQFSFNIESGATSRNEEVRNEFDQLQSRNLNTTSHEIRFNSQSISAKIARSDSEKPLTSFTTDLTISNDYQSDERFVSSSFESFTSAASNALFNRRYSTTAKSESAHATFDYNGFKRLILGRYDLFGIDLKLSQRIRYERVEADATVNDFDSTSKLYIRNSDLTNNNKKIKLNYSPMISLSRSFDKINDEQLNLFMIQVMFMNDFMKEKNSSSFDERNIERHLSFFQYNGSINYVLQQRGRYRYSASIMLSQFSAFPEIDHLYTIVDDINAYHIKVGNPLLKNSRGRNWNANLQFNNEKPQAKYKFDGRTSVGYTRVVNAVADSIVTQISGKRTYYPVNVTTRRVGFNYHLNLSRKFGKKSLQLKNSGNLSYSALPNFVDGVRNMSKVRNLTNDVAAVLSFNNVVTINLQQSFQNYAAEQQSVQLGSFKTRNNISKFGLVYNHSPKLTFSSTLERFLNSNLQETVTIINSFVTWRMMKQQGELKFSAIDLLKQYKHISNSVTAFGTSTSITNGLEQYFLLTFSYYPRKFGKTEIKRQADSSGPDPKAGSIIISH